MIKIKDKIFLGYEIKTGNEIFVKPTHLIVTGMTQLSGKTTTLEALVKRSGYKAIAFKTKIGETGFSEGLIIRPFFKERSDWQYVESLLSATMKEKMKFERNWIIKASRGANSLKAVYENCKELQSSSRQGSLQEGIYTTLIAYFELILPQLEKVEFSKELHLKEGINIMDLEKLSDEVQSLVIRSVLDYVYKNERETIVIIPEAWKFLPEDRGSPVKETASSFIRQGATNKNFLWLDSQDIASVDKEPLKQIANWILGLQMERNEVQHTLDQIPLPSASKPKTEQIMTLKIGHFFLCNPDFMKQVYVQPNWLDKETAKEIALGTLPVEAVIGKKKLKLKDITKFDEIALSTLREEIKRIGNINNKLEKENSQLRSKINGLKTELSKPKIDKNLAKRYNKIINEIKRIAEIDTVEIPSEEPEKIYISEWNKSAKEEPIQAISEKTSDTLFIPDRQMVISGQQTYSIPPEKNLMFQKLGGMSKRIYTTLMENPQGLTKPQIGLMAGYAYTSGSFSNALSKLNTMGLVKKYGDVYRVV
ncbi:MAG: hypothetical protein AABY15_09070 [Nanoarchaeota archaeon]